MWVHLVMRRWSSGAWSLTNGVGVSGASGVMGMGSVVFFRTIGRVVRLMSWCVVLGGIVRELIQHFVLLVLSCRPSGVILAVMVSRACLMLEWCVLD